MNASVGSLVILFVLLFLLIASGCFFIVQESRYALVVQFGKVVRVIDRSGFFLKVPVIDRVIYFNSKILDLSAESKEVIASDQKRLVVDSYAKYRITDPFLFYKSVGSERRLAERVGAIIESSMREKIGSVTLIDLLNDSRTRVMKAIYESVKSAVSDFGIQMVDVRIKKADLPEQNSEAVFKRMETDRHKEAQEIRAEGEESAAKIRADADRKASVMVSEAKMKSEVIVGEAEAKASAMYNEVFVIDPDFFNFYRSLEAYKNSITGSKTKFVLSPRSDFLQIFNNGVN